MGEKRNAAHNIATESWSPLGRGNSILTNEKIVEIAETHKKTTSQVVLRWHVQLGAIPIPKASSQQHQYDNLNIFDFELSEEEMRALCELTRISGRTNNQNPRVYEEF